MCKDNDKPRLLEDHLLRVDEKRVIVFVNTKNHCDAVSRQLDQLGFNCTVLHGGKTQACFRPALCTHCLGRASSACCYAVLHGLHRKFPDDVKIGW